MQVTSTAFINIKRRQFPLLPAYAITDYVAQGKSLDKVIVDIRRPPGKTSSASIYVALSRVKSLNGLLILRPWDSDVKAIKEMTTPRSVPFINEMKRLQLMEQSTLQNFTYP